MLNKLAVLSSANMRQWSMPGTRYANGSGTNHPNLQKKETDSVASKYTIPMAMVQTTQICIKKKRD
jgi:hypothetical protein